MVNKFPNNDLNLSVPSKKHNCFKYLLRTRGPSLSLLGEEGHLGVFKNSLSAIIKAARPIFRLHFSINNSAVFTTIDVGT